VYINRIVLTGGPGTGKTSILLKLQELGHACFEEISREIIKEELAKGSGILPWENLDAFSEKVINGRVEHFNAAKPGKSFYDRSIIDTIAYLHLDSAPVPPVWDKLAKDLRYYTKIFITPPWREIFITDSERKETFQQLLDVHQIMMDSYKEYGYELIEIPKMSIEERTEFVLEKVRNDNTLNG